MYINVYVSKSQMKILLINPTAGGDTDYGYLAKAAPELPQLGLASVATALSKQGHDVRIIDKSFNFIPDVRILEIVSTDSYQIVGLSVYVTTKRNALSLAAQLKEKNPNLILIVGGPEVTLSPDSFMVPYIDHIFVGEADESIVEFTQWMENSNDTVLIPGILSRKEGKFVGDSKPRVVKDIDKLAFMKLDRYYNLDRFCAPVHLRGKKVINMVSVRGCPYPCTFCAAAMVSGRQLRKMSEDNFISLVKYYINHGFDSFIFYDDTFTIDRKRVQKFCQKVITNKLKIVWTCFSRVDCVDLETLKLMREAGCYLVTFGCESFNDKTLIRLKKGFTALQSNEGINLVKEAGLLANSGFMIGLPGEDRSDIEYTIDEAIRSQLDLAVFPIFEPYKGTPIYDDCMSEGTWIKSNEDSNKLLKEQEEIWVPNTISRREIIELSQIAMKKFYLRRKTILSVFFWAVKLPLSRWPRLLNVGLDYFVIRNYKTNHEAGTVGSRFH